jgi:hypothetical protein
MGASTFSDLKFEERPNHDFGVQALAFYPNGYGVSVIKGSHTYGGNAGLYELAVVKGGSTNDYCLTYETPITDGVMGYLTPDGVSAIMAQVAALPKAA